MSKPKVEQTNISPPQDNETHDEGPAPIGTLFVIAVLVIFIFGLWMLILGIQQGRA